jgi:carboxyl-terminal processing protease
MRWPLACLCILLSGGLVLLANPVRDDRPEGPPLERHEAANYATQLNEVSRFVVEQYVRPVVRADLITAALKGLYEAAGRPVPRLLAAEVRKATASETQLLLYLARTRESLGNPEVLRGTRALLVSLQALAESLDPYCGVLTGTELNRTRSTEPSRSIGLDLLDTSGAARLVVKSVAPGGPAQKAGIRPGDQITHMDGRSTGDRPLDPTHLFQADQVQLTLVRPGRAWPRTVTLKPDIFRAETVLGVMRKEDNSWDYWIDPVHRIAHVRITALDFDTHDELTQVLLELQAAKLRGLILDLRWCPGGFLDESRNVADLFLDYGRPNAAVLYRDGRLDRHIRRANHSFVKFPVVVLINGESTGGAELVAAVLQDNRRASVAGQRTRGKASVQRVWRLAGEYDGPALSIPVPDVGLKLSNGILTRPNGRNLNRFPDSRPIDDWGVRPDLNLEFRVSPELGRKLQAWWQLQNVRPGQDRESLPLDDPVADPQRQAALRVLLDLLK